jgi:HSP20 family protein
MSLMKRVVPQETGLWNTGFPLMRGVERMQHEMNRVFDEFFRDDLSGSMINRSWFPAVDIEETADTYVLKAELPGIRKEDVKITFDSNMLTVRGEKKVENDRKQGSFHRIERSSGVFERSFMLPGTVKSDAIDAAYADGVLTITLPKKEEAKEKLIDVKIK